MPPSFKPVLYFIAALIGIIIGLALALFGVNLFVVGLAGFTPMILMTFLMIHRN